jgi:NAD(P)-dependent dehydrogenase (short-subunit alcohol dehydrogenase family)
MASKDNIPTILITGANGGLGSALALACAERGARLVLLDQKQRPLERLCDQVEALGAPAPGYCDVDLSKLGPEAAEELVAGLVAEYGGIDGLVHCAARFEGLRPMDQVPPTDWLLDLQVNLNAAWLLTRCCLASLKQRKGTVVFLKDDNAVGKAYWGSYGAAKAATAAMAESLANELGAGSCRVLSFDPGPMRTALRAGAYLAEEPLSVPDPGEVAARLADDLLQPRGQS